VPDDTEEAAVDLKKEWEPACITSMRRSLPRRMLYLSYYCSRSNDDYTITL
jgi:hypothetical protein